MSSHKPRIVLLVAALLLLAACGRSVAAVHSTPPPPSPTPAPTAPPAPTIPPAPTVAVIQSGGQPVWGKTASWSHANLPAGFGMLFHDADVQVAASDGKTAYACAVPGNQTQPGHPRVVVTHNGGVSWAYVSNIPVTWGGCAQLVVDMLDPSIVVAQGDFLGPQEVTFDGGQTWQALAQPSGQAILRLATRGDHSYAFLEEPENGGSSATVILAESSDHLRTWREIDGNLAAMNLRWFWINLGDGALMLRTFDNGLWTSTNDGATWQQMVIPATSIVDYMAQRPIANQPWRLCAEYYASQNDSAGTLICTRDGGQTWFQPPAVPFWQMAGIADDGALLVYDRSYMVYRLPVGATRWQKLGAAPQAGCCIAYMSSGTAGAGGILWKFPAESDGAATPDKPNDIYAAAYPY